MNDFFRYKFSNNEHISDIIGCVFAVGFEIMLLALIFFFVAYHIRKTKRAVHLGAAFVGAFMGLFAAKIMTDTFLRFFVLPGRGTDDAIYVFFVLCNAIISASIFGLFGKGDTANEDDPDTDQEDPPQEGE